MGFIQKSDRYSETISEAMARGFFDEDIFVTMRFSSLHGEEQFSNTMAFGNSRSWLYTGIMQWERMVDALEKMKTGDRSNVPSDANYNPDQVDDIIARWKLYDLSLPPSDPKNVTWVINHGWRYNRNLMHWAHAWEPIHRALLNGRFAMDSRTFKALIELGKNMFQRELEVQVGESEGKRKWLKSPFKRE